MARIRSKTQLKKLKNRVMAGEFKKKLRLYKFVLGAAKKR